MRCPSVSGICRGHDDQRSGQDFFHDMSVDVGQAEVSAGVVEGELFVVQAQQVQNGGLQVVNVDGIFDDMEAEFIGGSQSHTLFDSAAGQP